MENNTMKFLAYEGMVKLTCINTKDLVNKAIKLHNLSKTATKVFGDLLTVGAILGADLKENDDNITIRLNGDGILGKAICVSKKGAKVKGYIINGCEEVKPTNDGKIDEKTSIGNGTVYIIKDIGLKEPYVGIIEIVDGDIVNSFVKYFAKSEQIPTVLSVGTLFDEKNKIDVCGGYIIQLMPDATKEVIDKIEKAVKNAPSISKMLKQGYDLIKIAKIITGDDDIMMLLGKIENEYLCDCSKDRMLNGIASLGKDEISQMISENKDIKTKCQFCNKEYTILIDELSKLV